MKRIINLVLFVILVITFAMPALVIAGKPVIKVDNVADLYAAVNNEDNVNVVVKLKRGTYALTDTEINGGRLVLQPGMDLVGCNKYNDCDGDGVWDPLNCSSPESDSTFIDPDRETIIDGTGIDPYIQGDLIAVGHNNTVKRLTIKNMPYEGYALIGSSAEADPNNGAHRKFRVINCLLENEPGGIATIGVDCANSGNELDGAKTSCTLKRNIVRNLPNVGFTPDGFKIRNDSVDNAEICAILKSNRAYNIPGAAPATGHGLAVYGTDYFGGNDCKIKTVSIGNIYSQCGVGTVVFGAQPLGYPIYPVPDIVFTASGNSVHVTAIRDRNVNNYTQGGVVMAGAFALGGEAYDNDATVHMLQTHFVSGVDPENTGQPQEPIRQDLFALGGVALGPLGTAKGNKATLLLMGNTSDNENDEESSFFIIKSDPDNEMNLIGSEEMAEKLNTGVYLTIF